MQSNLTSDFIINFSSIEKLLIISPIITKLSFVMTIENTSFTKGLI